MKHLMEYNSNSKLHSNLTVTREINSMKLSFSDAYKKSTTIAFLEINTQLLDWITFSCIVLTGRSD